MAGSEVAINGDNVFVEVSTNGGGTWLKLGELTECSLALSHEPRELTDRFNPGVRAVAKGEIAWELSGEGNVAYASMEGFVKPHTLVDHFVSRNQLDVRFATDTPGDYQYSGKAFLSSFELTAGTGETQTYSISFTGSGNLSISDLGVEITEATWDGTSNPALNVTSSEQPYAPN
ncbi:MAG: phage tail tube protein [Schleiferiaceae bacterium]|nr:phage tail tube protein [Schleiferiaceae bacterium]MDR9442990.1 phage tail tube protein [Schleiferiaceae bacterium]